MIQRGGLQLHKLNSFILDEADEMLSVLFEEQVYDILQFLPESAQICLFSATLPLHVLDLTKRFMRDPFRILVKDGELTLDSIK
mmetsp:Transcript_24573/g.34308  ORF Transcript_24573/g.34308 Transcript_24573/m.34308 type:complete len:84 (-) Transcript_24573:276-527(-)